MLIKKAKEIAVTTEVAVSQERAFRVTKYKTPPTMKKAW
jgi:hypothetical protein